MTEKKSLKQKFLNGDKLNLLDNITIKLLQHVTDCDGICNNNCNVWYCNTYKTKQQEYVIN